LTYLTQNNMGLSSFQTGELFTLQLPSRLESLTLVEKLVEEIADKYKISEETFANMMICLNEAVINAITHGNKQSPEKKVFVNVDIEQKKIVWTVADEGDGFDYNNLKDPTAPENLENLTGRGVFILKQLSDQFIFNPKGNEVELHFKI